MITVEDVVDLASNVKTEIMIALVVIFVVRLTMQKRGNRPNIPGPFPWPVIGNVASLGDQPQLSMQAMANKYGPVYLMKLGGVDVLVLNDFQSIKEALGKQKLVFEGRPQFNSFSKISQGKGIVFNCPQTQGKNWRKLKTAVVRHLHNFMASPETRNQLSDHIQKESVEIIRNIQNLCRQSPDGVIDPETAINVSVANIVCALTFGHRYDYDNKEFQDLIRYNREFGEVVGAGSQVDVMPWIKIFPSFKKSIKIFDFLTNRLNQWMKDRTSEHRSTYTHGVTRDLVDTFISEGIEKPDGLLKNDVIMALTTDVFGAATDTLSTSLQWVLIYMMYFPEVQEKIQKELDSVFGDDCLPAISDIDKLPYTTAVLHEIFRHSTFSSTTLPHSTLADATLNGFKVPKGMLVFINQYAANHDPKQFKNPDEFKPERFYKNGKLIAHASDKYLLFSYGSRKCPGDKLSLATVVQMMGNMLHLARFESDSAKPTTLDAVYNLSMRPKLLRTKIQIRKPQLLDQYIKNLSQLSPHVSTIDSQSTSFTSGSADSDLSQSETTEQSTIENINLETEGIESREDAGFISKNQNNKFFNLSQFQDELHFNPHRT